MKTVYLETSIFGYLASRISADLITAGNQQLTLDWWENHRLNFDLVISEAVIVECSAGDERAAKERLAFLKDLPVLDVDDGTRRLAQTILKEVPLPSRADVDALHIAVAAAHEVDYLLTWNCKHIANPSFRRIIDDVLMAAEIPPPIICTPQELIYA